MKSSSRKRKRDELLFLLCFPSVHQAFQDKRWFHLDLKSLFPKRKRLVFEGRGPLHNNPHPWHVLKCAAAERGGRRRKGRRGEIDDFILYTPATAIFTSSLPPIVHHRIGLGFAKLFCRRALAGTRRIARLVSLQFVVRAKSLPPAPTANSSFVGTYFPRERPSISPFLWLCKTMGLAWVEGSQLPPRCSSDDDRVTYSTSHAPRPRKRSYARREGGQSAVTNARSLPHTSILAE